jgi:hypothetical protein
MRTDEMIPEAAPKPAGHIRTHADYEDEITEGALSDLAGVIEDLDRDINETPPWETHRP